MTEAILLLIACYPSIVVHCVVVVFICIIADSIVRDKLKCDPRVENKTYTTIGDAPKRLLETSKWHISNAVSCICRDIGEEQVRASLITV